ncbi:MAG: hypothetical protein JWP82_1383 [Humibacillus sp.]|nr:hypothetical protein [Humibacillus sp.]
MRALTAKFAAIAVAVTGLVVAVAQPASANDYVGSYNFIGEHSEGTGYWYDGSDTLCARANPDVSGNLRVTLVPANGVGASYSVVDGRSAGRTCTGNLSIPEDKKYRMKFTRYHTSGSTHVGYGAGYLYS